MQTQVTLFQSSSYPLEDKVWYRPSGAAPNSPIFQGWKVDVYAEIDGAQERLERFYVDLDGNRIDGITLVSQPFPRQHNGHGGHGDDDDDDNHGGGHGGHGNRPYLAVNFLRDPNGHVIKVITTIGANGIPVTRYYDQSGNEWTGDPDDLTLGGGDSVQLVASAPVLYCMNGREITRTDFYNAAGSLAASVWLNALGDIISEPAEADITAGSCRIELKTSVTVEWDQIDLDTYVPHYNVVSTNRLGVVVSNGRYLIDLTPYSAVGSIVRTEPAPRMRPQCRDIRGNGTSSSPIAENMATLFW
jgi:hypothetical protein